jgi:UDP-GlcNAc:undecaprenyl-phosphate/decaprenyl-phosphate GlcNAc-1-phosphate transferase
MIIITCLLIVLNSILFFNYLKIANKFDFLDYPDNLRKVHSQPTPYVGGIFIFINFLFFFILKNLNFDLPGETILNSKVLISCFVIFVLGLFDDKKNLNPFLKFILLVLIISLFLKFEQNGKLKYLKFSFTDNILSLGDASLFISILCYLIFINALNFFDGLNLQVGCYITFFLIILLIINFDSLLIFLFIPLLFFLYFNLNGKIFLGNNGSHFFGFLISYISINFYNFEKIIFTDQVVLLMIVPGIDMIRLIVIRLKNKNNPFFPDKNHMHHILIGKLGKLNYFILLLLLIVLPNILFLYGLSFWFLSIFIFFVYVYCIFFINKRCKNL